MQEFDLARTVIILLGAIPLLIMFALIPIIYTNIVKPLDKQFYGKGLTFEEGVWFASTIMRLSQYVLCIVFPERSKKDKYAKLVYQGYDFRGKASKHQVALSYCYIVCFVSASIFALLLLIYDFVLKPISL